MNWRYGSRGRVPTLQVQSPEFKSLVPPKKRSGSNPRVHLEMKAKCGTSKMEYYSALKGKF
jgi:hypothetical protein